MDIHFINKGQLIDVENDDIEEEEEAEDVEVDGIESATLEKKKKLLAVLPEYRLEVLHQYHHSQVAGD